MTAGHHLAVEKHARDRSEPTPQALLRRGLWLEYATLAWNVVGTIIVAVAAIEAQSVALAGFGLDSDEA